MRETSEMADSAEVRKKEGRRGPDGKGSKENEGREGDEKRTAVVRGYHELHNSWPSHNRAAQGCERADGMSFSFVSSRGDYFSFHSFFAPRRPLSLFLSPLLSSTHIFYLPLCCSFLPRHRILFTRRGPFFRSRGPAPSHWSVSRTTGIIKLLFYGYARDEQGTRDDGRGDVRFS